MCLRIKLDKTGVPSVIIDAIIRLVSTLMQGVSRGIPVDPHAIHILAECALSPTDFSFMSHGLDFCRYSDDIHVFCRTEQEAEIAVHDLAEILDKQQRLTLQRQKTTIMPKSEFITLAESMIIDRPMNQAESQLLQVIKKYSNNDSYATFSLQSLSAEDLDKVNEDNLERLFDLYLNSEPINFSRMRWLLRRLAQFGAPGAVNYCLRNIDKLTPALGELSRYIMRASKNYKGSWSDAGKIIVDALEHPLVNHSEYMQIVLIDLFAKVPELNHINALTSKFPIAKPNVRREIVVAAGNARQGHWIKERKDEFDTADPWFRRALLATLPSFPGDEATHGIKKIRFKMSSLEKIVTKWAFKNTSMKLGEIKIV